MGMERPEGERTGWPLVAVVEMQVAAHHRVKRIAQASARDAAQCPGVGLTVGWQRLVVSPDLALNAAPTWSRKKSSPPPSICWHTLLRFSRP